MSTLPAALAERIASAAIAEGLVDAVYDTLPSPIGPLLVVQSELGICRIGFASESSDEALAGVAATIGPRVVRSAAETAAARDAIAAYLEGDQLALPLPVDLRLVHSSFRRVVLDTLRAVPRGQTVTYGELATRAGHPRAFRAVGTTCATNPIPILVPCHRVLPATGGIGNYGGGPERKRVLLELEGALSLDPPNLAAPRRRGLRPRANRPRT